MKAGGHQQHSLFLPWDVNMGKFIFFGIRGLGLPKSEHDTCTNSYLTPKEAKHTPYPLGVLFRVPGEDVGAQQTLEEPWLWARPEPDAPGSTTHGWGLALGSTELEGKRRQSQVSRPWFSIPADIFKYQISGSSSRDSDLII